MVAVVHNALVLLASIACFAVLFRGVHLASAHYVRAYRDFSRAEQGDWCSRVNSTIHAVLIVTGMISTLSAQEWDDDLLPLKSTSTAATLFAISSGYFILDLYVLVRYEVPLWNVFVVHHVIAVVPYLIYNFHSGCGMDFYLLSLFLLVELAVIPLNVTTFLEQLGYGQTRIHTICFYTTYVFWFVARVVLPLYNVYVLWQRIIPDYAESPLCILPAAICGHVIAAFCVGVFVIVWTPDMLAKWRAPVLELNEYADYKLTLRQTNTPRSSPIRTPQNGKRTYGSIDP